MPWEGRIDGKAEYNWNINNTDCKTISGVEQLETTSVDEMKVKEINDGDTVNWINLPRTYSKIELPVDPSDVVTKEKIEKWDYLNKVAEDMPNLLNIDVGLSIGVNHRKALEPIEFTPSQKKLLKICQTSKTLVLDC